MEVLRRLQEVVVELENCAQMDDAGDAEGQAQKKRDAVPGAVISDQYARRDREAQQRGNDLRARPGQWVENDIQLAQKMPKHDRARAAYNCQPPGTTIPPESSESLHQRHIFLDAPEPIVSYACVGNVTS